MYFNTTLVTINRMSAGEIIMYRDNFNTTLVTINPFITTVPLSHNIISIQHLLLLIGDWVYIDKVGVRHFNTTLVTINHDSLKELHRLYTDFNTTLVTINRWIKAVS